MGKYLKLDKDTLEFSEIEFKGNKVGYERINKGVEGYIERVCMNRVLEKANIDVWCNEEGKLESLKESVVVVDKDNKIVELLMGNLIFTRNTNSGDSVGLTDEQILLIKDVFKYIAFIVYTHKTSPCKVRILEFDL